MINRCRGRKIKLQGFNNLTKSLSFNIYDICYAHTKASQMDYIDYIDERYNSEKLREILEEVTSIIQAKILNISTQDYDPRGASVTLLINEGHHLLGDESGTVVAHLDKSHKMQKATIGFPFEMDSFFKHLVFFCDTIVLKPSHRN